MDFDTESADTLESVFLSIIISVALVFLRRRSIFQLREFYSNTACEMAFCEPTVRTTNKSNTMQSHNISSMPQFIS